MSPGGAFFFLRRVALIVGVLLSSKSLLWLLGYCFLRRVYFGCWGTAFFEEFTLFVGVLACLLSLKGLLWLLGYCFLRRVSLFVGVLACLLSLKSCSACCVICFWPLRRFALLVGLLGLLRGGLLSLAFQFL